MNARISGICAWSLPAAALSVLAAGCMIAKEDEDDANSFSYEIEVGVLETTPPAGGEPGRIVTAYVDSYCGTDGALISDTTVDESLYHISGGKLYMWTEGACHVDLLLSGSSPVITGRWTSTDAEATALVPGVYREDDCEDEDYEGEDDLEGVYEEFSAVYTISSSKIKGRLSGKVCFAPVIAQGFEEEEDITVLSSSCGSVKIRNIAENTTATITSGIKDGAVEVKFASGDSTCVVPFSFNVSNEPPVCSEEDEGGFEDFMGYVMCVYGSGFLGESPFGGGGTGVEEKPASAGLVRAFHPALWKRMLPGR